MIDFNVKAFAPYYALRQGYCHPRVLFADYTTGVPLWEVVVAFRDEQYLLGMNHLATLAAVVYTIFLGSLQLSSSYYGGTTFDSDLLSATVCTMFASFILAVHLALAWRFAMPRNQFLYRPPFTLAASIPYVVFSPGLREDFNRVANLLDKRGPRVEELEKLGRRYALGVCDVAGEECYAVERHHVDDGRVDVKRSLPRSF